MIGKCPHPNVEGCPYRDTKRGCISNTHHLLWPATSYRTSLEKQFRELSENKEQICRWEHDEIHEFEFPPRKPPVEQMLQALGKISIDEAA